MNSENKLKEHLGSSESSIIIGFSSITSARYGNYKCPIYSYDGLNWNYLKENETPNFTTINTYKEFYPPVNIVYDDINGNYYLTDSTRYHENDDDIYHDEEDRSPKYSKKLNIYKSTDCLNWSKIVAKYPDNIFLFEGDRVSSLTFYNKSLILCWRTSWLISNDYGENWKICDVLNDTIVSTPSISTFTPSYAPSTLLSTRFKPPSKFWEFRGSINRFINPKGLLVANNYIFFLNTMDNMVYRTDLKTFTKCNNIKKIESNYFWPLAVAYDSNLKRYILCGMYSEKPNGQNKLIYYSDDGINWTDSDFSFEINRNRDNNEYPILGDLVHAYGAWWTSDLAPRIGSNKKRWHNSMYSIDGIIWFESKEDSFDGGLQLLSINNTLVVNDFNSGYKNTIYNITPTPFVPSYTPSYTPSDSSPKLEELINYNVIKKQEENKINTHFLRFEKFTFFTFPIRQLAPTLTLAPSITDITIRNILNTLSNIRTPSPSLDQFSSITSNQAVSVTIPVPDNLVSTFSNEITYPVIADLLENNPDAPMLMATTTKNNKGIEEFDLTQMPENSVDPIVLILPSLEPGIPVTFTSKDDSFPPVTFLRGNGTNGETDELSIDNGSSWFKMGTDIKIGGKLFKLSGIGSPVIFTVTSTRSNPITIFDYIFMYSYFFAVLGAIFYSVSTFISVDASSIIVNKNASVVLNAYITVCGLLSLCVWFNINTNFIISQNLFNQNVIIT